MRLDPSSNYQIWIERDENHTQSDKSTLSKILFSTGMTDHVSFSHADSKVQPLLWLPDAFAWLANRGGDWAKELKKFEVSTIYLD